MTLSILTYYILKLFMQYVRLNVLLLFCLMAFYCLTYLYTNPEVKTV